MNKFYINSFVRLEYYKVFQVKRNNKKWHSFIEQSMTMTYPNLVPPDQGLISTLKNTKINRNLNAEYLSTNLNPDNYGKLQSPLALEHTNHKAQ